MTSRSNKVKQRMNSIVSESRISFNPTFLRENIVVLSFQITHNLREPVIVHRSTHQPHSRGMDSERTDVNSLSI